MADIGILKWIAEYRLFGNWKCFMHRVLVFSIFLLKKCTDCKLFLFFPCSGLLHYLRFYTGNIGNIPLVLIAALCRDKSNPFGDSEKCARDGNAYISFGQWVSYAILFSWLWLGQKSFELQKPTRYCSNYLSACWQIIHLIAFRMYCGLCNLSNICPRTFDISS